MTLSTASTDMAADSTSRRPASGSLYSGRTRGPGGAGGHHRQGEQEHRAPPEELQHGPAQHGPDGRPGREALIQNPMAIDRSSGSWNMWKISDRVEGARVAPARPSSARHHDQHLRAGRERRQDRLLPLPKTDVADQQQPAAPDAVAKGPHGDQRTGDEKP